MLTDLEDLKVFNLRDKTVFKIKSNIFVFVFCVLVNEAEAFELDQRKSFRLNRAIIISGSIIGALLLFLVIDVICLIKSNCGLLASIRRLFYENKANSNDYKLKTPLPKIAQHQPKSPGANGGESRTSSASKGQYEPVETEEPRDTSNPQDVHVSILSRQALRQAGRFSKRFQSKRHFCF